MRGKPKGTASTKDKAYRRYKHEDLVKACEAVQKGMSKSLASKTYNVPRTTIRDRIAGRIGIDVSSSGPSPILTPGEEEMITKWIFDMSGVGFPVTRLQLKLEVKKILDQDGHTNPFPNNMPGLCRHFLQVAGQCDEHSPQT